MPDAISPLPPCRRFRCHTPPPISLFATRFSCATPRCHIAAMPADTIHDAMPFSPMPCHAEFRFHSPFATRFSTLRHAILLPFSFACRHAMLLLSPPYAFTFSMATPAILRRFSLPLPLSLAAMMRCFSLRHYCFRRHYCRFSPPLFIAIPIVVTPRAMFTHALPFC